MESLVANMDDFWVFGYGSLMWRPGFDYIEKQRAKLFGYRRTLCIHSHIHRGTPEKPGLVLGLDRGGSCSGVAFKVSGKKRDEVFEYLHARELVTNVYLERIGKLQLSDQSRVSAYCYVADLKHRQYAKNISVDKAVEIVSDSVGQSGHNIDYVTSTVEQLRSMNLRDHWLEDVVSKLPTKA